MLTYTESSYCNLLDCDDRSESQRFVFEQQLFRCTDETILFHEYMTEGRIKPTTTKPKYTQNIWKLIEQSQDRGPMYSLPPKRGTTSYRCHTIQIHDEVNIIYFDVDNHGVEAAQLTKTVEALRTIPHAIWCRSPSGGFHVFVIVDSFSRKDAEAIVQEWVLFNGVRSANNVWYRAVTGSQRLDTIMVPGQDPWSLPCEPGNWDTPIAFSFDEAVGLFADVYENHRQSVEDVFKLPEDEAHTSILSDDLSQDAIRLPLIHSPPKKRNRPRLGSRCNITGVTGSIGLRRIHGRFDYRTIGECLSESDGLNISIALACKLMRKHRGNRHEAEQEFRQIRPQLRDESSKKHDGSNHAGRLLRWHTKQLFNWAEREYAPAELKHDEQQPIDDRGALSALLSCDSDHVYTILKARIRNLRREIIRSRGRKIYDLLIPFLSELNQDIFRFNGRVATRSKKTPDEYTYDDTRCMTDYKGMTRRLVTEVKETLEELGILVESEVANWSQAKCARWTYDDAVIVAAEKQRARSEDKEDGIITLSGDKAIIPLTNIGSHEQTECYLDGYSWNKCDDYSMSFDDKLAHSLQSWQASMN